METTRTYHYPDVNMLMACETICHTLQKNIGDLSVICPKWTNDYITELHDRIDYCIDHFLGIDTDKSIRHASARLMTIREPAIRDLYYLKKQLELSFKGDKNLLKDILSFLGLNSYLDDIFDQDHQAIIQLLLSFKNGLTDPIRQLIIERGTSPLLIERILGYHEDLPFDSNIFNIQVNSNGNLSADAIQSFNSIYKEISHICKEANCYYHFDPLKKEQFSFAKVISKQSFKEIHVN